MTPPVVFWQRMLSPHMTELARELALAGTEVHYVYEEPLSSQRCSMGWQVGEVDPLSLHQIRTRSDALRVAANFPEKAVHLTQGIRANGLVGVAQKSIMSMNRRHFPMIEKVDLRGLRGWLKPFIYAARLRAFTKSTEGILAIGEGTADWLTQRHPRGSDIYPFAYFLRASETRQPREDLPACHLTFAGSLIRLKRVDLLLDAIKHLRNINYSLEVIGDGPERAALERQAKRLGVNVTFQGFLPHDAAVQRIAAADCLILPSDHDGWGAVVSEALIHGTPVICSSACGAATVVKASGTGAVFPAGDKYALCAAIQRQLGPHTANMRTRQELSRWAGCLTAKAGASYLTALIASKAELQALPSPPWLASAQRNIAT